MFGYIVIHKPELKIREYEIYRACYCGLCRSLKKRHGRLGQLTLSFDMTFLALLLSSLYEPNTKKGCERCVLHPFHKHAYRENLYFDYAADMNLLLTYYKCLDDWQDEKKYQSLLISALLKQRMKRIENLYPKKTEKIKQLLEDIRTGEKENSQDIDKMAGFFGKIMAELFVYRADEWEEVLYRMGFFFGKFIYLMDAYEDIEEDLKKKRYNPLTKFYQRDTFEQESKDILKMMMAEASRAFEHLPILEDVGILRNILYAGVWTRYSQILRDRKETEKKDGNQSI